MPPEREPLASAPAALLLTGPGCPHCASVRQALETLRSEGLLGGIEEIDLSQAPQQAEALGVRSVPWTRIGAIELSGLHSLAELRHWAALAARPEGLDLHLADLLGNGQRAQVLARTRREPALIARLAALISDPDSELSVRIGVMATLEELKDEGFLHGQATHFLPHTTHPEPRVRSDACYALTLIGGEDALAALRACSEDPDPEVMETAQDGVEVLTRTE
ncbi:thioredoxin family protein [Thioalkalivibrio sulfidiphilus]|uniref:thioredoxin family protein n=1 Tax=Thioalkalivibrio sulfidiphilus TaxID=1033854 RepID=UPI000367C1DE|nr:thioredoxin family protein [Thioalkalivibrio sulfidiphilus]